MVVRPKDWLVRTQDEGNYEIIKQGGYYLSKINDGGFIHKSYNNKGIINLFNDNIIKTINYLQSVEYIINIEVLEKLLECITKGLLNEHIILDYHPDTEKLARLKIAKDKKALVKEIISHNSLCYVNKMVLTNAILFRNNIMYFPVFIDFRGRLYPKTAGFSYQGSELIKSLLYYNKGMIINESGLKSLKYYAANCYGFSKKSNLFKLNWIDSHLSEIINIENGFWLKNAKDVLLALAVSIELKNYYNNPSGYLSRLPVFIDATCNGLQHLSAMVNEVSLAKRVNIYKSTDMDIPEDVYSIMVDTINTNIQKSITKNSSYSNLDKIFINRSLIKRSIMTIAYGVTREGIKNQLIDDFFVLTDHKINSSRQFTLDKEYIKSDIQYLVYFSIKDITELANIIHKVLYNEHTNLRIYVDYLYSMNRFLHKLDLKLGVVWKTPSGLIVEQKYVKKITNTIKTNILKRTKSINISKPSSVVNLRKQNLGIVPNLVHSMDASNISLFINNLLEKNKKLDISTVHDCFASQANNIELISYEVKYAFWQIYKDQDYINEFHNFTLKHLSELGIEVDKSKTFIEIGNKRIAIPTKPVFKCDFDLKSNILNSKYFIH